MAFDYQEIIEISAETILEFGAVYKLTKAGGGNAGTVAAVLTNQEKTDNQGVIGHQKVMLIAGNNRVIPEVGMFMTSGKEVYRIQTVERVQPGKFTVIYKAEVEV